MRLPIILLVLLLASVVYADSPRGVLADGVQPIDPARYTVELGSILPVWTSADLSEIAVSVGVGINIPQPKGDLALLTPDKFVGFLATTNPVGLTTKYTPGASLDWVIAANMSATVVGVGGEGVCRGIKVNLLSVDL